MNELSLFSGAGGGVLGSKILGWRTIGYVEYEAYCQKVLQQRISDGILDAAPIFGDIRKFISDGWADRYRGKVDIVTGGFPCQPFSVAGKGLAENDPRNMWPETLAVLRRVRPRRAFFENVPGLIGYPYFRKILREIAESGYDIRWDILGASDVGGNHRRKRLWILAYTHGTGPEGKRRAGASGGGKFEPHNRKSSDLWNTDPRDGDEGPKQKVGGREETESQRNSGGSWWSVEPNVGRVAHGVARRVDRLRAVGNGQVALCMAYAYALLSQGIVE